VQTIADRAIQSCLLIIPESERSFAASGAVAMMVEAVRVDRVELPRHSITADGGYLSLQETEADGGADSATLLDAQWVSA